MVAGVEDDDVARLLDLRGIVDHAGIALVDRGADPLLVLIAAHVDVGGVDAELLHVVDDLDRFLEGTAALEIVVGRHSHEDRVIGSDSLAHGLEKIAEVANIPMGNGIILQNFVLFYQIQLYLRKGKGESGPSAVSFMAKGMEEVGHLR